MAVGNIGNSQERTVVDRINGLYLVPRKSSEVFDGNKQGPITATLEVRIAAANILSSAGIEFPEDILTSFRNRERVDLKGLDEITQWDIYWAQEMAAAHAVIPSRGGSYEDYLPGRFMHYDLLVKSISDLFNSHGKGIVGKKVCEAGSGSGLGLVLLSLRGAKAYGIDTSRIGIKFARYLTRHFADHFRIPNLEVNVGQGSYFQTGFTNNHFDVVYNSGVAEHLDKGEMGTLVAEMVRITKPGGYVIIAVPNEGGVFYKRYKATKEGVKEQFPTFVGMPADSRRNKHDIRGYMEHRGLDVIKEDGLQVAPSVPIKAEDIREGLSIFDRYLPRSTPSDVESRIAAWRGLEAMADPAFRIKYGWTLYYVGQKPAEIPCLR